MSFWLPFWNGGLGKWGCAIQSSSAGKIGIIRVNLSSESAGVLKPVYGRRCRVGEEQDQYGFFMGIPAGALLAVNLALLASGVYYIWKAKDATAGAARTGGGAIQKNL